MRYPSKRRRNFYNNTKNYRNRLKGWYPEARNSSVSESLTVKLQIYFKEIRKAVYKKIHKIRYKSEKDIVISRLGKNEFEDYFYIENVVIKPSVKKIREDAFKTCIALKSVTLPEGITEIESNSFQDCRSLTSINLPNSIKSIGFGAFSGCSSLTDITIPENIEIIESYLFDKCSSLKSIAVPNGVKQIKDFAFCRCTSLESISIPNSVTTLDKYSFELCESLTSIIIPNSVTEINEFAFKKCSNLKNAVLSDNIRTLKLGVFEECTSLKEITIPFLVEEIGFYAFADCSSLEKVTLMGFSVKINKSAFSNVASLRIYSPYMPIEEFPEDCRLSAIRGYADVKINGGELSERADKSYSEYIRKHAKKIIPDCANCDELFSYMLREKLIPKKAVNGLLEVFNKRQRTDLTIELLEYSHNEFSGSGLELLDDDFDESDDDEQYNFEELFPNS